MKYDVLCIPGPPHNGCGKTRVSPDIGDDHARGDRVGLVCPSCNVYGEVEIRGRLEGLA